MSVGYKFPAVSSAFDHAAEQNSGSVAESPTVASPTHRAVERFRRELTLPCNETVYYHSYNPACTRHYVSVVTMTRFTGKDDEYMARLRRHVQLIAHKFHQFGIDGEVIVVNYNSESKISSATRGVWGHPDTFFNVLSATHEKFCNATEPVVDPKKHKLWEYYAKNIGIRRARGTCWGGGGLRGSDQVGVIGGVWELLALFAFGPGAPRSSQFDTQKGLNCTPSHFRHRSLGPGHQPG